VLDTAVDLSGVTVGGSNTTAGASAGGLVAGSAVAGTNTASGSTVFDTTKPLTWNSATDELHFTLAKDGAAGTTVSIRRGTVQTALNNSATSVTVSTSADMVKVLQQGINDAGVTGVTVSVGSDGFLKFTSATTGTTSDVAITWGGSTDNDTTAGTLDATNGKIVTTDYVTGVTADKFEPASAVMNAFTGPIQFTSSTDKVNFSLALNGGAATAYTISKSDVDAALGTTDGKINSVGDFQTVLATKLSAAAVTVGSLASGKVTFTSQSTASTSAVAVSAVSTEGFTTTGTSIASISVDGIDISTATLTARGVDTGDEIRSVLKAYITVVNSAINKVTSAAAALGSVSSRIDMQKSFVDTLMDTIDKGVSNLIDADMSEESTKLQALQVKQQLGVQSLSIANQSSQTIL
ncbi:flagellin, partial [Aureimonas endophytica]|uniref:flagellin n=1 Tax=Aureimonas endophytica TaxID=2027858 RepID=UPI001AEE2820